MRVSIIALPALAALAYASPCRPSSSETTDITTTSSESILPTSTSETTSLSSGTETTSTVEESTTSLEPTTTTLETTTSTVEESTPSLETEITTTSLEITTTTTTTSLESTTTSAAPTTTVLGFCIKAISTDKANYGYHVSGGTTVSNQLLQPPTNAVFNLYNLDVSSGVLTLNNTDPGKQIYLPSPYSTQNLRVVRFTTAPVTNGALQCSIPSGEYKSGSAIACTGTGTDASGSRTFNRFAASNSASTSPPWQMLGEGLTSTSYYTYEMAIFFGSDCKSTVSPAK
ncbi:hypothetical protein AK830_g7455 [Neonectria ditissima]|uniref:Ubiquitin 3 binding protein But2 C-terminal domain-containing protein n=1 Tax=Neonectria ditissima TaxID=78410 RepID=A0A0N8H6J2_9HYPO|nr:hypothetical protein AK830_g7455 [Neonectria ditissima]